MKRMKCKVTSAGNAIRDKKGNHFYEGDIVEMWTGDKAIVTYSKQNSIYQDAWLIVKIDKRVSGKDDGYLLKLVFDQVTIIGNVDDNKDLLQKELPDGSGVSEYDPESQKTIIIQKKYIGDNARKHREITDLLYETYVAKNHDYGDSFGKTYEEFGMISALVRISDKYNRLAALVKSSGISKIDESLEDTLLDMANYCIMSAMELQKHGKKETDDL